MALCAVALNWQSVFSRENLPASGAESDLWTTHWGNAAYLKLATAQTGNIPLWNPHTMSGRPFAGDPLAAIFYPPMQLVHLLPLRGFFLLLLIGHLLLGGVGTYLLARRGVRLGMPAAFFAAIAWMWSPQLISHYGVGHLTMIMAATWLPWVALALVLAIRDTAIWAAPAGVALGLAILAGHPQIAFYHLLMLGGITAGGIVWVTTRPDIVGARLRPALRVIGIAAVTGLIGGLIGAALVLPALEFTQQSARQGGLSIEDRLHPLRFLLYLIWVPFNARDFQELTVTPGLPVLALTPLAWRRRPRLSLALLGGILIVAILALGAGTPVLPFLGAHLPGFAYFRAPARIWFVGILGLALLSGIGFEALVSRSREPHRLQRLLIVLLLVMLAAIDLPLLNVAPTGPGRYPLRIEAVAAELSHGTRIYGVQRNVRQAVVASLDLHLADGQDPLQIARYAEFMQAAGGYRFDGYALGIPPFEVYDPPWPTQQDAQPNARLLGLLHVGIVLSRTKLVDPALQQIGQIDRTYIYRNGALQPRAFLINPDLGAELARADSQLLVTRTSEGQVRPDPAIGTATINENRPDRLAIQVVADQDAYLIIGDPWYPGWTATIDGQTVPVDRVGGVLRGLPIPAGTHTVLLRYQPLTVWLGLGMFLLGLLLAGLWTYFLARHHWRRNASSSSVPEPSFDPSRKIL